MDHPSPLHMTNAIDARTAWPKRMYQIGVIRAAHARAIERQKEKKMTAVSAPQIELSPTQMSILEAGTKEALFCLTTQQRGKAAGILIARGWIKAVKKGTYTLTREGKSVYESALISQAEAEEQSGINRDDPALHIQSADNEGLLKRISHLEQHIDDLERLIEQRDQRIEALTRRVESLQGKKAG